MTAGLVIERHERHHTLRFGDPDRPTVLEPDLLAQLTEAVCAAGRERLVRTIVLSGQPRWFCVGADLSVYTAGTDLDARAYLEELLTFCRTLWNSPKVVIAAVSGLALGGGAELSLWCDLRICAEDSQWGFPEVGLGALPGAGGVQLLSRLVGLAAASYLVLTGERVDGRRAVDLGVAHACVPAVELDEHVGQLVERVNRLSPVGLALAKRALHASVDTSVDAGLSLGLDAMHLAMLRGDAVEGISAFFDRRQPDFQAAGRALFDTRMTREVQP